MFIKHSGTYSLSKRKLRVLGLSPKGRFMILNSAVMLPLWELKTFIKIRIFSSISKSKTYQFKRAGLTRDSDF